MSAFEVLFTPEATERLRRIAGYDPKSARVVFEHMKKLPETYRGDPFLSGRRFEGLRRNRVGKYRAIYRVLEDDRQIHVLTVDLRKSVYES
ncbi:MAG: type II toxin-antitoxin system RelE/ParE family toxin [Candidatus Omnitrophota bacterium]